MAEGVKTSDIAKLLNRNIKTVKKAIQNINYARKPRVYKGKYKISNRDLRKIKKVVRKHPYATSRFIFNTAGVYDISKNLRNKTLRKIAMVKKAPKRHLILPRHKEQRLDWSRRYMKLDFSRVIFTDEMRATLDGPDGWRRGWVLEGETPTGVIRRQQGGGGIMIWAAIVGKRLIGPFKVDKGVKMNSENYSSFLDANFFRWYKSQTRQFKAKCIFMHDNAPAHASQYTKAYLTRKGIKNEKIMQWPANSPDLNPIENLWFVIKRRLYPDTKQYKSKTELWEALQEVCKGLKPSEIEKLTTSMDDRLFRCIKCNGGYVKS